MKLSALNRHLERARARSFRAHEAPLIAAIKSVFVQAGDEAARRFEESVVDHLSAAAPSSTSAMIAVYPLPEEAVALAQPGGEPAEILHVTLAFLGETDPDQAEAVAALVRDVAVGFEPVEGVVGGVGTFGSESDEEPVYPSIALPDVPGLAELRHAVCEALDAAGVPYAENHGWTPHVTLAYVAEPVLPPPGLIGMPLTFDRLTFARGDVPRDFPLEGASLLAAAGNDDDGTVAELATVAEEHEPEGGYGETAWNPDSGTVFWVCGDWTSNEEYDAAEAAFRAVEGVKEFEAEAEAALPDDDGWVQVWPAPVTAGGGPPDWSPPHGDEVVDVERIVAQMRTKTDPVRLAVAETMLTKPLESVGLAFDVTNPLVAKTLAGSAAQVTYIAETTRLNVMRIIREAYGEGLTIPDTAKAIRVGMRDASTARATLIARTELVGVVNGGAVAAGQIVSDAAGIAYEKRWLTAPGAEYPRHEDYEGLDGQTVDLDALFDVGGYEAEYPGDQGLPPDECCNCRCAVEMVEPKDAGVDGSDGGEAAADTSGALDQVVADEALSTLDEGEVVPPDLTGIPGAELMAVPSDGLEIYRTEQAHEAYKGKAVWGEGRYFGTDREAVADLQIDPNATHFEEPDFSKVDAYRLPENARILDVRVDDFTSQQIEENSGEVLREKVLAAGYDGVHIITESANLGGDQIVLFRSLAEIEARQVARDAPPAVKGIRGSAPPAAVASGAMNDRTRRLATRATLTASGVAPAPKLLSSYELTQGSLAERWYIQAALDAGYTEMTSDSWPTECSKLEDDERVIFRDGHHGAVYRFQDGTVALVSVGWGRCRISTAGPTADVGQAACAFFRDRYPASYLVTDGDGRVPITFWMDTQFGPQSRLRRIDAATWADIEGNYPAAIRDELASIMAWSDGPDSDGQLGLLQGPPGTGKTWVLRALASEWASWAEFHYITDPDAFFVKNSSYMIDVLLSDSYDVIDLTSGDEVSETDPEGKWRVLILEDTGELLAANAKEAYGQGLSRLLNVVDGMIGQGLRVMALVTTNDELGDLHPAVKRDGRCAVSLEFGAFSPEEASEWLGEEVETGGTLAELYARRGSGVEPALADAETAAALPSGTASISGGDVKRPAVKPKSVRAAAARADRRARATAGDTPLAAALSVAPDSEIPGEVLTRPADAEPGEVIEEVTIGPEPVTASGLLAELLAKRLAPLTSSAGLDLTEGDILAKLQERNDAGLHIEPLLAEIPAPAPADVRPERQPTPSAPETGAQAKASQLRWEALFCPEGKFTDDGRLLWPDSTGWRELPLTLMAMLETSEGGHVGAEVAGRIDNIWRESGPGFTRTIRAGGVFDDGDYGAEVARLVDDRTLRGLSVDLAIRDFRFMAKSALVDENGLLREDALERADAEVDLLDILFGEADDDEIVFVATDSSIGAATVCPFPAFEDASIGLVASADGTLMATLRFQGAFTVTRVPVVEGPVEEPLTAAAAGLVPVVPPAEWFEDPELEELTAVTVTDEGRVFGHAAVWDTCHIGIPGVCRTAPQSATNYAYFLLGEIDVEGGEPVAVGKITLGTGHANQRLGRQDTTDHYDNSGTAVADVTVGEDEHGIWISGALRPDVPAERVRELKASVLSGDWRAVNGNLELVALLAVNVPGFPVPRQRVLVSAGAGDEEMQSLALVAAGVVERPDPTDLSGAEHAELAAIGAAARPGLAGIAELARGAA